MAREINRLTAAQVKRLGVGKHHDGGGLYLIREESRAAPGQINASWYQRFVSPTSRKERWMGLGSCETFGLADARALSRECRQQIANGQDPIEVRDAQKASEQEAATTKSRTFEVCAREYMAAHEAGWRNAKHRYQWTATLNTFAYPVIGKMTVDAVTTDDIMKILGPIWATTNETASRLRGRIEVILDAAKVAGHRTGENPARWDGHLEHLLAPRKKVRKGGKQPALPWEQVPEFLAELRALPGIAARALEFAISSSVRWRPIWLRINRTSGLVGLMSAGGTAR